MKLIEVNDWRAVHFQCRTVLSFDRELFSRDAWHYLIHFVEVEPMEEKGHYRAI